MVGERGGGQKQSNKEIPPQKSYSSERTEISNLEKGSICWGRKQVQIIHITQFALQKPDYWFSSFMASTWHTWSFWNQVKQKSQKLL